MKDRLTLPVGVAGAHCILEVIDSSFPDLAEITGTVVATSRAQHDDNFKFRGTYVLGVLDRHAEL